MSDGGHCVHISWPRSLIGSVSASRARMPRSGRWPEGASDIVVSQYGPLARQWKWKWEWKWDRPTEEMRPRILGLAMSERRG
jgi:hypothetical protein